MSRSRFVRRTAAVAATVGFAALATLGAAGTASAADQNAATSTSTQSDSTVCGVDILDIIVAGCVPDSAFN